jgi:hypothetical protein
MKVCNKCKVEKPYNEFSKDSTRKDGKQLHCKECRAEAHKVYRKSKKDEFRNRHTEYMKQRRAEDPLFRLIHNMRCRVTYCCKSIIANKKVSLAKSIGITKYEFKSYIESKFQDGMTWDNYGDWHVDHIKPLSMAKTKDEVMELNHYTNLQPLWAIDNIKKSNKYE